MAKAREVKTLDEWRKHKGLTVQVMADGAGLTRGAMGDYIKGRKEPGIRLAYRIAGALGVEVTQIADWQIPLPAEPSFGEPEGTKS
jgi:transcriptional regulator with XRE-family HTH domain